VRVNLLPPKGEGESISRLQPSMRGKNKSSLSLKERVGVRVILGTAGSEESVLPGMLEGRRGSRFPYH